MTEIQDLTYMLVRKNVKNINLRVKPDGSVVVSANPCVPKKYVDDFVRSKQSFIQKAKASMEQNRKEQIKHQFLTGEQVPYLGSSLLLDVHKADSRQIPVFIEQVQQGSITNFSRNVHGEALFCKDGCLCLYTADVDDTAYNQQLYDDWQKIQAGSLCEKISRQYYPVFKKWGVAYPKIKIRKMRWRWGSCIPARNKITFNSLLMEKPLESIEYVVVHEFSHFIHPDHSDAFYRFVEQILPDWKSRKEGLR